MLVSKKAKPSLVDPMPTLADPTGQVWQTQCGSVEYGSCWVREVWVCVGHVHFMLFVTILFAFGTQHEPSFQSIHDSFNKNMNNVIVLISTHDGGCLSHRNLPIFCHLKYQPFWDPGPRYCYVLSLISTIL